MTQERLPRPAPVPVLAVLVLALVVRQAAAPRWRSRIRPRWMVPWTLTQSCKVQRRQQTGWYRELYLWVACRTMRTRLLAS